MHTIYGYRPCLHFLFLTRTWQRVGVVVGIEVVVEIGVVVVVVVVVVVGVVVEDGQRFCPSSARPHLMGHIFLISKEGIPAEFHSAQWLYYLFHKYIYTFRKA